MLSPYRQKVVHRTEYFGLKVEIMKTPLLPSSPFGFRIIDKEGKKHLFGGGSNFCERKAQALKRSWYRCKWMANGTLPQN